MESDKTMPRLSYLEKLADLYEINIEDLISERTGSVKSNIYPMIEQITLLQELVKAKDALILAKDEKIADLEQEVLLLKKVHDS